MIRWILLRTLVNKAPLAMRFGERILGPAPTFFDDGDLDLVEAFSLVTDKVDFEIDCFLRCEVLWERSEHCGAGFFVSVDIDPAPV